MQPIPCPPLEQPNADNTACECRPEYPYSDGFGKCACPEPNQMLDAHLNCISMPLPCGHLHEPNLDNTECVCKPQFVDDGSGACSCPNPTDLLNIDLMCVPNPIQCGDLMQDRRK